MAATGRKVVGLGGEINLPLSHLPSPSLHSSLSLSPPCLPLPSHPPASSFISWLNKEDKGSGVGLPRLAPLSLLGQGVLLKAKGQLASEMAL